MTLPSSLQRKVYQLDRLQKEVSVWKRQRQKIIFTNGCFDLIHAGHLLYLSQAANLGDKLLIGLNSDASARRLKGPSRPVNDQWTRSLFMVALSFVDGVIVFEEDSPQKLIATILPDILVKGGDYKDQAIAGATEVLNNGGKVQILEFWKDYSSSAIIKHIRDSQGDS